MPLEEYLEKKTKMETLEKKVEWATEIQFRALFQ